MIGTSNVGMRVLVVEDEPSIGRLCLRTLTADGYKVEIATNGKIAQAILHREEYDLYLIDVRTPEVNGMELYQYLEKGYPELVKKVVFTTGDVLSNDIGSFVKGAGRPFLPKPFTPEEMRATVRKAIAESTISNQKTPAKADNGN